MADYKLEFSGTTIPHSEHSRVVQNPDGNKAYVISNNTLYEFEFSNNPWPTIRISKDNEHPLGDAKLLYVEPLNDNQTAIIVKVTHGLRIYVHSQSGLYLAVEDDQFHDVFEWNKPGNEIHFGHFYHDPSLLGMMSSHANYGTKFFAIFKDVLLSGEFPIYPLDTNVDIFKMHSPQSFDKMLANLDRKTKTSIVACSRDSLSFFNFNKANGIVFVKRVPHSGTGLYNEQIFFADLTHREYNDMAHFNSSGMFMYQYVDKYQFIHYNPLFSEEKGWTMDHTNTVRFSDINSDGFVDMVFTGPRGTAAITYDTHANLWTPLIETSNLPPSMRHAHLMHVTPQVEGLIANSYLIAHLDGSIRWARLIPLPASSSQEFANPVSTQRVIATSRMTPLRTQTPEIIGSIPLLRDMNIWTDILNCVGQDTGKPKFKLPLVDFPDPALKLILNYDATSTVNDVLGIGWSLPLNLIAIDDQGSIFDEDAVFVIAFQDSTQALKNLPKESTSVVQTYTLPSRDGDLKFRARFYPQSDQWIVDVGNGVIQIYGQLPASGATTKDIVWRNWHGSGFDGEGQVERSRMWYLAKVQDEHGNVLLEFLYDTHTVAVNSGLKYTKAVYLKGSRDYQGNEIAFRYQEKPANEYKTYDAQDNEGNYIWEPVQTRCLTGYTLTTPSGGQQVVNFVYRTWNGHRFLEEIRQDNDVVHGFVARFEYLALPMGKFSLENVQLPYNVRVEFTHVAVGENNPSKILRRTDVLSDYKVTVGEDYVLLSFLTDKGSGQIALRMFNRDMTEELYTSDSRVKMTTKGRWPLLGEYKSVVAHDIIRGDDFFGVILFYSSSKWLCLFAHAVESEKWLMDSACHEYGEESVIQAGRDFCLVSDGGVELFEWQTAKGIWMHETLKTKPGKTAISVYRNKFVTYDDSEVLLSYKTGDGTWHHNPLVNLKNCLSGTEGILKRFNLKAENHKLYSAAFRNNILKFNSNLVALNCLQLNDHQLQSSLRLFTIGRDKKLSDQHEIIISGDNLREFVSKEEKDTKGNYFTFKYEIKENGEFYIKVHDFRGPLQDELVANGALKEKPVIKEQIERTLNHPAKRLLFDLQSYIMSFTGKVIMCHDQKLTFGGKGWQRKTLTKSERAMESVSLSLGDKFILEKTNKESHVKLLRKGNLETLSVLTVNLTDVRVFYPVYLTTQAKGAPVRLLEFDDANVKERVLPRSESFSPYSNAVILITHEGQEPKTVIFREQFGIRKFEPNHVVSEVTVVFDDDRKKRVTGYEYDPATARLTGDTVVYSQVSVIPANDKTLYGWLEQSLTKSITTAYNSHGEIVRHIPSQDERSNDDPETAEEQTFRKATTIYDKFGKLEIAQCAPFRLADELVGYYGFEDYEVNVIGRSKQWNFETSNVIRNGFALTGKNYLHQAKQPVEGIFQPVNQDMDFIASSWVRLQNVTVVPRIGEVAPYLKAIVQTTSGKEVTSLLSETKFQLDDWIYLELIIDLRLAKKSLEVGEQGRVLQIAVRVGPTLTTPIDIDHVRFAPLTSDFNVNVFDSKTNFNTAVIASTGWIQRQLYDVYNTAVSKINEQNQVETLTVYTKAGRLKTPRCTVRVRPETGFYEQFAPFSFANRWKITHTSPWMIAPYQLEHRGNGMDTLELSTADIDTKSYGFRVIYSLSSHRASLLVNDFVELSQHATGAMLKVGKVVQLVPAQGEILLTTESDRLLVWIDGGLYIDQTADAFNKPLKLAITGTVVIKDMMVFSKATIKVVYQNSLDETIQEISLEGPESIVVKERLYDELGRQRITTQDVRVIRSKFEPLLTYIPNFVTNDGVHQLDSVWKTGLLSGLATNIIGHPYGFVETRYDNNPLNEKTTVGLPGKEFSTSGQFFKRFASKTANLFVTNRYPLSMNVSYQVELKPGGVEDITVMNRKNEKIAHYVHVPGSIDLFATYKLNEDGQLVQSLPPLYFERVGSFHKTNSDLLKVDAEDYRLQRKLGIHIDYDRNGKPSRKTSPDAGPVENIYDEDKQLRFILYYSHKEPNLLENIVYFTYDELGRLTSTGQFLNTAIHKDQLLSVTFNGYNSILYQSFNYASFERDPTLRGRLLRTITMNNYEPFAEVMYVNQRGDTVDKRIILADLTKKPDEIVIHKTYSGGRLREISYPAKFLSQPFSVVYGYDRLGRINSIGTPQDPSKFLRIAHNAAGQITEEAYEPGSVYTFKQKRDYNAPGFLTKLTNQFQTEEISYTGSSYGGASRGDGSVTRIRFTANWHGLASSRGVGLRADSFVRDFMSPKDSTTCFEALKGAGYLDHRNRQVKAFYPDLEIDFPIICTAGISGRHVSNILGRHGFPFEYGHRFDYGAHQDLTKAKYFIGTDEPEPLQPDTFAKEILGMSTDSSRRIWTALKAAQFIVEDPDRTNLSTSHGKESRKSFIGSNLFADLKAVSSEYASYAAALRKLLTSRYFKRQGHISALQMQDFIRRWLGKSSSTNYIQRAAVDIFEMLRQKRYFLNPLDTEFQNVLKEFGVYFPEIVRVLHTYFGRQLGRSEFDVESYEIDANGNHKVFNTGFNHYALKYEQDSNRVEGVQYKAFDSQEAEKVFQMQHDSRGNVIQALHKGILSMEYHPVSNLLQRVRMADGNTVEFYYDSKNERVLKRLTGPDGKTRKELHYLRDDQGRTLVERELSYLTDSQPPAVMVTMYVYGSNGLVGFVRRDQFYSVITDHQGSVRLIIRDGEVVAAYDYLPYGSFMRIFGDDSEAHIPYRYTGQEWDPEMQLYNYHARFYDPSIGRFYQIDPKEQYFSPYKYAGNSPVSMVDPTGEIAFLPIALMLIGAYFGGAAANNSLDFTKWNWKSPHTYLGIFFGGFTGYLLPGGFLASVDALVFFGLSKTAAISVTVSAGLAMSYFSAASANGKWFPHEWELSARTLNALFEGFSMGASAAAGFRNVSQFYKGLQAKGKILFVGGSVIVGSGLFVMGGIATDWDLKKPQFWFATISSILSAPELVIFGARGHRAIKNGWQDFKKHFRTATNNYDNYVASFFILRRNHGRSLPETFREIFEANRELGSMAKIVGSATSVGVAAFLMAAALNDGFNWNMTDVSTYQNLVTAIQVGSQVSVAGKHGLIAKKKSYELRKAKKALAFTEEIAKLTAEVYKDIIKAQRTIDVVENGNVVARVQMVLDRYRPGYSDATVQRLQDNQIPNTALSVVVAGKIAIVGFSSNRAPGVYLVYDHDNLTNPSFKAAHIVDNNAELGGSIVTVRDDPDLSARIVDAINEVQSGIQRRNKIEYRESNLHDVLTERVNLNEALPVETRNQLIAAIDAEVMRSGYVTKRFIANRIERHAFENANTRAADAIVNDAQAQLNAFEQLPLPPREQRGPHAKQRTRLNNELRRVRRDRDVIIAEERLAYLDQLHRPMKFLEDRLTTWEIGNCAEPHTTLALERQARIFGLEYFKRRSYDIQLDIDYMATYKTRDLPLQAESFQRCDHCMQSTALVQNVLTDTDWMINFEQLTQAAAETAKKSGARLQFLMPIINLQRTIEEETERKHRRSKRSENQIEERKTKWYESPLRWMKSFKSLPKNDTESNTIRSKTILELGDEFLSKMDMNGTFLLANVILAKCRNRKLHQMSNDTIRGVSSVGLLCNIVELFEDSVVEAAELSGIPVDNLSLDSFPMQQEVMPLLRKHEFERIAEIMVEYAVAGLGDHITQEKEEDFRIAFSKLRLDHTIGEKVFRTKLSSMESTGIDIAYSGHVNTTNTFDSFAAMSYDRKLLN